MEPTMAGPDRWHLQPEIEARIRREALEEAAKVCEGLECPPFADNEWGEGAHACAEAIRALISPEPS
jgi:hypothetical protein